MKRLLSCTVLLLLASLSLARAQVDLTDIHPADDLGASIKYSETKFDSYLKVESAPAGSVKVLEKGIASEKAKATVLDFETASGFPAALVSVEENGAVARVPGLKFMNPAVLNEKVGSIQLAKPSTLHVDLEWRTFDLKSKLLSEKGEQAARGAFLVSDRGPNDTMSSGTQGITWVPAEGGGHPGGILFSPNTPLKGFAFVANNQAEDYTLVVAAFDQENKLLFTYSRGFPKGMSVYLGVESTKVPIDSIWVGQLYPHDGTVLDDIVMVPAGSAAGSPSR